MSSRQNEQIGRRIAAARSARRMSQSELAKTAHVSLSTLRKAEQGSRPVTDRVLQALSAALEIDPERLTGQHAHTGSRVHQVIPAIRVAIDAYDLPGEGATPPLPELRAAVATATRQRLSSQYTRLAESVPILLSGLTRAVHCPSVADPRESAVLLAHAYRAADAVAFKYGYHDLSGRIIELMRWAARLADDPLLIATAAYVRTEIFFASDNLDAGLGALDAALDEIATTAA